MISFVKRCRTDTTAVSRRRIWRSTCGQYRVIHSRCMFGPRKGRQAIPDIYYAQVQDPLSGHWDTLSKHHEREPAFGACQEAAQAEKGS